MSIIKDQQTDIVQDQSQQEQLNQQETTPQGDSKGAQDMDKGKDMADELETLRQRVVELEPKEKSDAELKLEQKAAELWVKEVALTLKENQLEEFLPFISAKTNEELSAQIEQLKAILKATKMNNSFVPTGSNKANDQYSLALSKKDTKNMIASKLSGLFK